VGFVCRVPGWVGSSIGPISVPVEVGGRRLALKAESVPSGGALLDLDAEIALSGWLPGEISGHVKTTTDSPLPIKAQILGIKAEGQAFANLAFGFAGDTASISGSVIIQKCVASINPLGFIAPASQGIPETLFDVDLSIGFGPGVRIYFPSPELPVVMGYADPASALTVKYKQETGELSFKGSTILRGGEVFYIQRDFFLKSARIVFNETAERFDPLVTLYAERRARNDKGSVLISLRADSVPLFDMRPLLSSSPPMTEGQIASLLGSNLLGANDSGGLDLKKAVIAGGELVPGLDVTRAFEEKLRDVLGLDILFIQTQVVQRWLVDVAGIGSGEVQGSLASYLDDTTLYLGKYIGDNIFLHAAAYLQKDPLVPSGPLRLDSEFGIELEAPFGLLTWSMVPKTPQSLFISDQSISISWRLKL
jgi:translocation and assembly module TamB